MFGRERDVRALEDRVRFKGLTAVVGRPQMGKSWLLNELARRLAYQHNPSYAVGFAESFGQTPDLLARAVADLYTRWLSDSAMAEQARMVWKQQKGKLLGGVAGTVSKISSEVFGKVAKPVTVAVDEAIKGLIAANETLTSGGLKLPTLHYEQARDLVSEVTRISGRPIVLVLDRWEKSPDAKAESHTLDAFLRHLGDWPACHVFLALRPDEPAYGIVEDLAESLPGAAQIYALELLDLEDDAAREGLLSFLNWQVPAVRGISQEQILASIDGYPGVIYQWTSDYQREAMHSAEDLEGVAADAHEYRFSELDDLLSGLDGDARRLAARIVLLPIAVAPYVWEGIRPQVIDGLDAGALDDLQLRRVLESAEPPNFGHAKRWDAARAWFIEKRKNAIRPGAEALILAFAARIRDISSDSIVPTLVLAGLQARSLELEVSVLHRGLCEAAVALSEQRADTNVILRAARVARAEPRAAPLMAMGLFNTLDHAKQEDDLARRDALLDELRALAEAHQDDAAVRERLAKGLFNTLNDAKQEDDLARRDALLGELRALAEAHQDDAAVREWLARGLLSRLIESGDEDDLDNCNAWLDELGALAEGYPDDPFVQEVWRQLVEAMSAQD